MNAHKTPGEQRCEYAERDDVETRYLADRLSPAEAEAFEAHYFACETCWNRVQQALELRRAFAERERTPEHGHRTAGSRKRAAKWWPLAAAAGLSAIAFGVHSLRTPAPVFRSVEQSAAFAVEVGVSGNALSVHWAPVPGAAGYELRTFGADGRVLQRLQITAPEATLESHSADPAAAPILLEVVALDEVGQVLDRSQRVALPE